MARHILGPISNLKTFQSVVLSRSFQYHNHPDDIQRKILGDQRGLLDWVSLKKWANKITKFCEDYLYRFYLR